MSTVAQKMAARPATPPGGVDARPVLSLRGIDKQFPGVKALSGVDLDLYPGEVTALVGENGAGKSTIVKVLTGIYKPDAGTVSMHDQPLHLTSAQDAVKAGIAAIHQETVLFDELTVAENVFIGHAPRNRFGAIDHEAMRRDAAAILKRIGADINPAVRLADLGIASRHLVAIARALSAEASVVVLDEPTAALSAHEIEEVYALVERLKEDGKAILFISHKFDEIFRIADRWTVFRDGELVGAGRIDGVSEDDLVRLMVGRHVGQVFPERKSTPGAEVLAVKQYAHPTEFDAINFTLRTGEILGFYGLVGAGRSEVMQALFGVTKPSSGEVLLDGKPKTIKSPADAIEAGIVYVPEDRGRQGAVLGLPIVDNVALPSLGALSRGGFVKMAEEYALARTYTQRLDLRAAALDQDIGELSGGNQQKVVIAKWLATKPRVIILDEPTKGIDIGSKAAVHDFMAELAAEGLAVIMVSSEIPEVLGMSDRVIVMREGLIVAELSGDDLTPERLVREAAGYGEAA
ncbi:MAG: sugar ABC transporter ATP-binding protein [Devosiaceae bacterium]|nr:sugar ABC transporter ATP-binding protein [Devosiaceae bacterium MH13]